MLCNSTRVKSVSCSRSRINLIYVSVLTIALVTRLVACDRGTNIGCFRRASASSNNMHLNIRADSVDTCISNCEKLFYRYV